jgi:hypothetical protein
MMQPRMNYPYTQKELDDMGLEMLFALGEPIVSDGSTIYGRGNARFMVRKENENFRIVSMH